MTETPPAAPARVPRLTWFFPAHNEERNVVPLLVETADRITVDLGRR